MEKMERTKEKLHEEKETVLEVLSSLVGLFQEGLWCVESSIIYEALMKLKKEFWSCVESLFSNLTGTVKLSNNNLKDSWVKVYIVSLITSSKSSSQNS